MVDLSIGTLKKDIEITRRVNQMIPFIQARPKYTCGLYEELILAKDKLHFKLYKGRLGDNHGAIWYYIHLDGYSLDSGV